MSYTTEASDCYAPGSKHIVRANGHDQWLKKVTIARKGLNLGYTAAFHRRSSSSLATFAWDRNRALSILHLHR